MRPVSAVPAQLATFDPADWPGATVGDRLQAWIQARRAWAVKYGGWPRGALTRLREEHAAWCRAAGWPAPDYGTPLRRLPHSQGVTGDVG